MSEFRDQARCQMLTEMNGGSTDHDSDNVISADGKATCDYCSARYQPVVRCDESCAALEHPTTLDQALATAEHYRSHSLHAGCSHGN